jgi:ATP-dependent Lon protease
MVKYWSRFAISGVSSDVEKARAQYLRFKVWLHTGCRIHLPEGSIPEEGNK